MPVRLANILDRHLPQMNEVFSCSLLTEKLSLMDDGARIGTPA